MRRFWNFSNHSQRTLDSIRNRCAQLQNATDGALKIETQKLRDTSPENGVFTNRFLIESFGLMTEAVRRTTSKIYYDVQLKGGLALVAGCIAEMQTGEGKTLTTGLPAFTLALCGRGVHVATTNSYLAERDSEELRPAFEQLGLTVGVLPEKHDPVLSRKAYQCDVTFGTGYDFGFDFLRDQIALRRQPTPELGLRHIARLTGHRFGEPDLVQRPHAFAIVDEADSVLIDEATMPLILSVPVADAAAPQILKLAAETASQLQLDEHFTLNPADRSIDLTDEGWIALHAPLKEQSVTGLKRPWSSYVEQALRAKQFLIRDIDYVVVDNEVQIVDQNTGRIHPERSWRDGLHQAVEVKEQLAVSPEKSSEGRVSRQRYFQLYDQLCGMTGTATGNEPEFSSFYSLNVIPIPTHRPGQRKTLPTRCFADDDAVDAAIVADTASRKQSGQPVLLGTLTIKDSKRISDRLHSAGVTHTVLNGVQDEAEAEIIARSGRTSAVTIATNMAGRGTDIKLDPQSLEAGGLHVIAAGHNISPRVDRQLAGRAARQGQPGSVQFFVSATDELFVSGDSSIPDQIVSTCDLTGESRRRFEQPIGKLQAKLEKQNFQKRQQMVQRDQWLDSVLATLASREEIANAR